MLNVKKFTDSDYIDCAPLIEFVSNHFKNLDGSYYTFEYKDELRVVYKADPYYMIFFYNDEIKRIDYSIFGYEDENDRVYVDLGNYIWYITKNSQVLEDSNGIIYSLDIAKRQKDYSGLVYYVQYDFKTDTNITLFYEHHYMAKDGEKQRIYDMRLKTPSNIAIRRRASKKEGKPIMPSNSKIYARVEFKDDKDGFIYNKIKGNNSAKYYRAVVCTKGMHLVYLPILTTGYTYEEMMNIVKSYGFRTDVPDELVRMYNGDLIDVSYYLDLVKETKELDKGIVLTKRGDMDGKNIKM